MLRFCDQRHHYTQGYPQNLGRINSYHAEGKRLQGKRLANTYERGTRWTEPALNAAFTEVPTENPSSLSAERVTKAVSGNPQSTVSFTSAPVDEMECWSTG